jgi:glycosyltransferase involved in cell wall biosynthesis
MRCLWLTRFLPYPPFYGGDALYTERLIDALAATGTSFTVLCYALDKGHTSPSEPAHLPDPPMAIDWKVLAPVDRATWKTLLGDLPSIAERFRSPACSAALRELIAGAPWDAVIIDHIGAAGLADGLDTLFPPGLPPGHSRPTVVYLSHNHETSVRALTAAEFSGNPVKKLALRREAAKVARLEAQLVEKTDIVTPNTEEDAALFRADHPGCTPVVVKPGYSGPVIEARAIDDNTPRRATIVGSFGWIAKQMNLEAFLGVAAPKFAATGAEIEILGTMPNTYKAKIERAYPSVLVRGQYEDVAPYLAATRLGIVPEQTGGGFKHKALSYAFCRVPVAAIEGSVAGMPLKADESIVYAPDMNALADTCLAALDDFDLLNRLQDSAFRAVKTSFDWSDRGCILADAIRAEMDT